MVEREPWLAWASTRRGGGGAFQKAKTDAGKKTAEQTDATAAAADGASDAAEADDKANADDEAAPQAPFVPKEGTIVKLEGVGKESTRESLRVRPPSA